MTLLIELVWPFMQGLRGKKKRKRKEKFKTKNERKQQKQTRNSKNAASNKLRTDIWEMTFFAIFVSVNFLLRAGCCLILWCKKVDVAISIAVIKLRESSFQKPFRNHVFLYRKTGSEFFQQRRSQLNIANSAFKNTRGL